MSCCLSKAKVYIRVYSGIFDDGVDTCLDKRLAASEVLFIGCDMFGVPVEEWIVVNEVSFEFNLRLLEIVVLPHDMRFRHLKSTDLKVVVQSLVVVLESWP